MLGVPFGHPVFVKKFLQNKISEHKVLLDRIPAVQDTQPAWLLLSFCAAAQSNFFLRAVSPQLTQELPRHTTKGCGSVCRILSVHSDCGAHEQSSLPLWESGIVLRSARRTAPAVHWASWADALKMIKDRHPAVVDIILDALRRAEESMTIPTVVSARKCWSELVSSANLGRIWLRGVHLVNLGRKKKIRPSHVWGGNNWLPLPSKATSTTTQCGQR